MKKICSFIIAAIFLFCGVAAQQTVFKDISGHWAENEIIKLNSEGIVNGYGELFKPDNYITRGELAVILDRVLSLEGKAENTFSDLDEGFYTESLLKCSKKGIISGYDGKVRPKDKVTRQEAVVMLGRATEKDKAGQCNTELEDMEDVADWAKGYVSCFVNLGYLNGSGGKINPGKNITRAEIVKILYKCLTEESTAQPTQQASEKELPQPEEESYSTPVEEYYNPPTVNEPPVITSTLSDGITVKNSKKSFDVWANDYNGNKIPCTVLFNDTELMPSWEDSEKVSCTIFFTEENIGENTVKITATDSNGCMSGVQYKINYEKAQPGDIIGTAVWSVEAFPLGNGYIVPPLEIDVVEGENMAEMLEKLLAEKGFETETTGSTEENYYLAAILDGTSKINNTPNTSQNLIEKITEAGNEYNTDWVEEGRLGEFDFSQGSGWMYSINNIFPNLAFSETYPSDGDVIRVQFSLCYGRDNGGCGILGNGNEQSMFFESPNRDTLTRLICEKGFENCPQEAIAIATKSDATTDEIAQAEEMLK